MQRPTRRRREKRSEQESDRVRPPVGSLGVQIAYALVELCHVTSVRTHNPIEEFPATSKSFSGTSRGRFVYMAAIAIGIRMMMRHDKRDDARDVGIRGAGATCDELRAHAWSYLDGELTRAERRWIHAHLIHCAHCRDYVQYLRAFLRVLRAELKREHQEPSE